MATGRYFSIGAICFSLGIFLGAYAYSPRDGYEMNIRGHNLFVVGGKQWKQNFSCRADKRAFCKIKRV